MSRLDGVRTLLLDSSWRPLKAISWKRAILLDLEGRIDVVEYYEDVVRTPHTEFPLPAVVRLRQYLRLYRRGVAFSRRNVLLRDRFQCQYCGEEPGAKQLTIDHVMPRSRGGRTSWDNVVTACGECNRRKGSRTPQEARMVLRSAPERPLFLPYGFPSVGGALVAAPPEWAAWLQAVG